MANKQISALPSNIYSRKKDYVLSEDKSQKRMRVIADLHIHSRYSRATSAKMNVKEIARFARIKGLNLVGTGDFSHPKWLKELTQDLAEVESTNLYKSSSEPESLMRFMVTNEVSTIFTFEGKSKKVHHVILSPSLET
jgi:PHP family Zn ribbon phosphoesterase